MKEVTLPSKRILKISLAPFRDSRDLYQAVLEEAKGLKLDPNADVDVNLYKDLFCTAFSSKKIELALWKCVTRAVIDDLKISEDTFEKIEHRDDYMTTLMEVAKENLLPFMKSLYAEWSPMLAKAQRSQR